MEKILLLGSTGSIGTNTLAVIREYNHKFEIEGLSANRNVSLLEAQVTEFKPKRVYITDKKDKDYLKIKFPSLKIYFGDGLRDFVYDSGADTVISSISGFAGLLPTYYAIESGKKKIGLANKESMVCAGSLLKRIAEENKVKIIPIDSEHSTIFKLINGHNPMDISKITLTASGGPFLKMNRNDLKDISIERALNHPRWKMGKKISIDSATMANKVLEVIEAYYFFDLPLSKIDIIIHPQSIIHSFIKTRANTYIAELGPTDMRVPIANAMFYPNIFENSIMDFDIANIVNLEFFKASALKFPFLKYLDLVRDKESQIQHIAFNASNEEAVNAFLRENISFLDIERIVFETLQQISGKEPEGIFDIMEYDMSFRSIAKKIIMRI